MKTIPLQRLTSFYKIGIAFLIAFSVAQAFADEKSKPELSAYKEIGFTLGTPAVGNLVFGYWSANEDFPWIIRVSGMDYGNTRGIEGDFGWAFSREGRFKQYVALNVSSGNIRASDSTETIKFTGAGPVYGFNLYGFALQAGLNFGSSNIYYDDGAISTGSVYIVFQIGYTYIW